MASQGAILQSAISTAVAAFGKDGGRKANAAFQKLLKNLIGGADDPTPPPQTSRRRGS